MTIAARLLQLCAVAVLGLSSGCPDDAATPPRGPARGDGDSRGDGDEEPTGDGDGESGDGDSEAGDGDSEPGDGDSEPGDGDANDAGGDGDDDGDGGTSGDGDGDAGGTVSFPPVTDLAKPGPFTANTVSNSGPGNKYTVYAPKELGKDGLKHPIITWGNGAATQPSFYTLLPHLASHGFVVIASNTTPGLGISEAAFGQELKAGIDWLLMENGRSGGPYQGKLDPTKISSTGYSFGSLATFTILDDPRLTTTLHISGGNMSNNQSIVSKMRVPAAFICGEDDIADPNCKNDFDAAPPHLPLFYATFKGGDHLAILGTGAVADRIRAASTGWLRWRLMGEATQASMFVGSDCTLCKDTANWVVRQRALK